MNSPQRILKNARALGEHGITAMITDHAHKLYPTMTREAAFAKFFVADSSAEDQAFRALHSYVKGANAERVDDFDDDFVDVIDEAEAERRRRRRRYEADEDDDDPLQGLELRAKQLRARNPTLTPEQAFVAIYTDPGNASLVKRERAQAMAKLYR